MAKTPKRRASRQLPKLKPWKELAPSTQKRLRSYAKTHGLTTHQVRRAKKHRTAARGHKPHEHVLRKEHERAKHGMTNGVEKRVRAFHKEFNPKGYAGVPTVETMINVTREKGLAWFDNYTNFWKWRYNSAKEEQRRGVFRKGELSDLEEWVEDLDLPDETWLFIYN